jgi:adenosylhomocysteine nucleosidase
MMPIYALVSTLVFFAVKEEARFFHPPEGCTVKLTGMGPGPARTAVERALASSPPSHVFTCGFAGGLNPALPVGALAFDAADERVASTLAALGAIRSAFHCLPRVATTRVEKARLRQETGADVVEMESGIVRQICQERKIPATTLRVISDTAEEDLPLDFNTMMTSEGTLRLGGFVGQAVFRPDRWPALWSLQKKTSLAARILGATLEELLRRLG